MLAIPFLPIHENKFNFYLCSSFYFSAVEKTAEMSTKKKIKIEEVKIQCLYSTTSLSYKKYNIANTEVIIR